MLLEFFKLITFALIKKYKHMKKLMIILTATTIMFTACSKKDTNTTLSVVGKWNVDKFSTEVFKNNASQGIVNISVTPDDYYDFKSDGQINMKLGAETNSGTYSLKGNALTIYSDDTTKFNIALSANTLTASGDNRMTAEEDDDYVKKSFQLSNKK